MLQFVPLCRNNSLIFKPTQKMNTVKRLMLFVALFFGMFSSANAQGQGILSAEEQEQVVENVSNFMQDLNLSERDKPAFRDILSDFFVGLVALRATNFSMDTNKKVIKALVKGRDARVKGLLSTDQNKVYKARVKERQSQIREFMKQ